MQYEEVIFRGFAQLRGESGKDYQFNIFLFNDRLPQSRGVYAISKEIIPGDWVNSKSMTDHIFKVDKTDSLASLLVDNKKIHGWREKGASRILVYASESEAEIDNVFKDVFAAYNWDIENDPPSPD